MEVERLKDREDRDQDWDRDEREMNGWMDRLTGEKYMHLSSLEVGGREMEIYLELQSKLGHIHNLQLCDPLHNTGTQNSSSKTLMFYKK